MLYINTPDYTLHRSDYSDTEKMRKIFGKAEESISFLKSSLGEDLYSFFILSNDYTVPTQIFVETVFLLFVESTLHGHSYKLGQ